MTALNHFHGFRAAAGKFCAELSVNNTAEWFHAHKAAYERDLRGPMADLIIDLGVQLAARDVPLAGDPKKAIFRINRDVRFSRDKSPYKTNISAVLSRDGNKQSLGSLYLQVGLGDNLAAMGFYALGPEPLAAIRDRILAKRDAWYRVVDDLKRSGHELSRNDALARLPRGYDSNDVGDLAETIKLKSFVVSMPLTEAALGRASLVEQLADFATAGLPVLKFGWDALV